MSHSPAVATELVRQAPLGVAAAYLNFIGQYGAAAVTTVALVYGVTQFVLRIKEHRAIMRKNKE